MKPFFVRPIVLGALVALAVAAGVRAQAPSSSTLGEADIRRLIASSDPKDHARLSAHFAAEAERYAAEAKRHESMQKAFTGNTKLAHMATSQGEHCRQLAARDLESAATLRELAAHHKKMAAGVASEPPKGGERFEGAAGARVPSDAELTRLASTAESAADHRTLAGYFTTLAARHEREAKDATAYAAAWRDMPRNPAASSVVTRWERLAKQHGEAAAEARAAAAMHTDHARAAK